MKFMMRRTIWAVRIYFVLPYELFSKIIISEFKTYLDLNKSWFLMPIRQIFKNSTSRSCKPKIIKSKNNRKLGFPYSDNNDFQRWLKFNYPEPVLKRRICISGSFPNPPTCSFIMPLYKPEMEYLFICIESILKQSSDDWELCIYADGVPNLKVIKLIEAYSFWTLESNLRWGKLDVIFQKHQTMP